MSRLFILLVFTFLLLSLFTPCDNGLETVTETDEYGNSVQFTRRKTDFAREGWYTVSNPAGQVIEAAQYLNDTLNGQRILFYDNGDTSVVENYQNGGFEGPYRRFYETGTLKQVGQYVDNLMEGFWQSYHENGQLKEKVQFHNNDENGAFIEYHSNGKLAAEGTYLEGDNEDGELKIYDENGELLRKMTCNRGRCQTIWSAEQTATNE